MHQPISWSALADASVGVWGLGRRGTASVRRLSRHGRRAGPGRRRARRTRRRGPEVLATGRRASTRSSAATWWSRARASAATAPTWRGSRRPGSPCAVASACRWRRPIRPVWPASPAPRGRARPPRWRCTSSPGSATAPGPAGTSATRPGTPPRARRPTTGSSRRRASRCPTSTAPRVVAVTSLSPDHLDWHGTVERYYADKLSLCTKPGVALAMADGSDERSGSRPTCSARSALGTRGRRRAGRAGPAALGLPGPHNAAQRVHRSCRAGGPGDTRSGRRRPDGRGGRRASAGCPAGAIHSAGWARSSSSTTASRPTCCRRRPHCAPSRSDRSPCSSAGRTAASTTRRSARTIARRVAPTLVVTMPDNGPRIGAAVPRRRRRRGGGDRRQRPRCRGREARSAGPGPAASCCCRPAAPSFGRFADYRERSAAFAAAPPAAGRSAERRQQGARPAPAPRAR